MKIKSIAAICKKNKNIAIFERYSDDDDILTQYIGDGSAVYPVIGLPPLDAESLLTIFDVPEKDRDNYFVKTLGIPAGISFEDTDATERQVEREGISIIYSGRTLKPIRTTRGLVFIESRYLAPVADVLDVLELYERRTTDGAPYRQMFQPLMIPQGTTEKRFDTDFYVEGFATTFDKPYVMYEYGGIKYCEVIDRNALVGADLSDVIMQFDHSGMVFARNKMAKNKPPSLLLETQESGLFIAANLSLTEEAKRLYASIDAGLICKMSWAFTVSEDAYNKDTHTRTILKIKKVYDVSAVSYPANADTDISARSYFDGVIEAEKREALARKAQILKIKLMMEV